MYFTIDELQGVHAPAHDVKSCNSYRKEASVLMNTVGQYLALPQLTVATGTFYFHRYFSTQVFLQDASDRFKMATACLFLATKVEETPRKLRDVIKFAHAAHCRSREPKLIVDSPEYEIIRKDVLKMESDVLHSIAFCLQVVHPYASVLKVITILTQTSSLSQPVARELAQTAWNIVNDSLQTTLCLQFPPELIASSAIFLASKFQEVPLSCPENVAEWWLKFGTQLEELDKVTRQILDLYPGGRPVRGEPSQNGGSGGHPHHPQEKRVSPSESIQRPLSSEEPKGSPKIRLKEDDPNKGGNGEHPVRKEPERHVERREGDRREGERREGDRREGDRRDGPRRNSKDFLSRGGPRVDSPSRRINPQHQQPHGRDPRDLHRQPNQNHPHQPHQQQHHQRDPRDPNHPQRDPRDPNHQPRVPRDAVHQSPPPHPNQHQRDPRDVAHQRDPRDPNHHLQRDPRDPNHHPRDPRDPHHHNPHHNNHPHPHPHPHPHSTQHLPQRPRDPRDPRDPHHQSPPPLNHQNPRPIEESKKRSSPEPHILEPPKKKNLH